MQDSISLFPRYPSSKVTDRKEIFSAIRYVLFNGLRQTWVRERLEPDVCIRLEEARRQKADVS